MAQRGDELHVTEGDLTLPAIDVLTGRGFVTGKSGSGKSNTASVLVEELLEHESRLLIVDTDGEYYGLKEDYEVLHLGASDRADAKVGPEDAETIADMALAEGVPVVLDVSGFLEGDKADRLVYEVCKQLFSQARDVRQPFLLLVEEVHEFVPEQGGLDDVGEMVVRIAKRGRKRGLGLCGLSQRPASVDKDFITQCDWLVWHRLTWANDTRVVDKILGGTYSTDVESLGDGEAFLVADWEESVKRVQFRRKRTFDAGATPGYGETDDPNLKSIDDSWIEPFEATDWSGQDSTSESSSDTTDDSTSDEDANEDVADQEPAGVADASDDDLPDGQLPGVADGFESEAAADGRPNGGSATPSGSGSPTGTSARSNGTPEGPPADAKTAIWELGQLVVHLASVAGRRAADALLRFGRFVVHSTDAGLRAIGYRVRSMGSRAIAMVTRDRVSSPITTGDDGGIRRRSDTPESAFTDRAVGLSVALAVVLFAYAVVTLA